jgi:type III secretory pathway component EscR
MTMNHVSPEFLLVASVGIAAVPLLIAVGSCYLKFSIVLSLLRSGFGTQQAPSAALVMGLSLVMSLVVMQPVLSKTTEALSDIQINDLQTTPIKSLIRKGETVVAPWRSFLLQHSGERELRVFSSLADPAAQQVEQNVNRDQVSLVTALAAFVLSEIKKGFTLAFFLLVPFFVIDLIVSNVLVAMGLTMMSPVVVGLPIKLLLFITSDGWLLLSRSLIRAYQ